MPVKFWFVTVVSALICVGCGGSGGGSQSVSSLSSGLIHWWKFNGDASDSVGSLSTTPIGPVTYASSPTGQGIVFNGVTTGISLPPVSDMQFQGSFTVSAWASLYTIPTDSQLGSCIIFDGDDRPGLDPYALQVDSRGHMTFLITGNTDQYDYSQLTVAMPLNTMVLVTGTYDRPSGTQRLYFNGGLVGEVLHNSNLTPVVPLDPSANPGIGIGTSNAFGVSGTNEGWNGEISDLRVYNRALTGTEVSALYALGLAGTPRTLSTLRRGL